MTVAQEFAYIGLGIIEVVVLVIIFTEHEDTLVAFIDRLARALYGGYDGDDSGWGDGR